MSQSIFIQNGVLVITSRLSKTFNLQVKKKFNISIKTTLLLSFIMAGVVSMFVIYVSFLYISSKNLKKTQQDDIKQYAYVAANLINSNGYLANHENNITSFELDTIASIYNGRIIVVDSNLRIIKDTYNKENGKVNISKEVVECLINGKEATVENNDGYIQIIVPVHNSAKEVNGVVVMGYSQQKIMQQQQSMADKMLMIYIVVLVLLIVFAIALATSVGRPFKKLNSQVAHISDGYLDDEVNVNNYKEFEQVSESINSMMVKMKQLENSRQEFVSNVSHELKTPITSMKVLADSLIAQPDVPVEFYKEFMEDITKEIDRENKIITDLLSMVKMDTKTTKLNVETVNINELLELLLKRIRPIAKERNIEIIYESFRPVEAEIDETKLSLALSNLIENAVKYNYDDGWVRVSLNADHKFFYVKISDSGVGIPKDCQNSIFDRFYRVDKARSRETGGTGLGLSITRNVILLHKGAIKVYSKEKEGTTFTVRIPINYIA